MGKTSKSGLGVGTGSSPQGSLSQGNVDSKVKELTKQHMIEQLTKAGVKFNQDDVLFVTKDKTDQLVWLENGNKDVGLTHIKERHFSDFIEKHGIKKDNIVEHLRFVITTGKIEYSKTTIRNGRLGYERLYNKNGQYYLLSAIGTNGFLVTAYPVSQKTANALIRRNKNG
ncbi:MAG: hypothetical protein PUC70_04870 [bacterium]|nr:hypothetical protein [bacterium]